MSDFNLEEEYGDFVDLVGKYFAELSDDEVTHFGVKGMHWGVRKSDSGGSTGLNSLGPDTVTVKTASGESVTLQKRPPNMLHKVMGKLSSKYREDYEKAAYLDIKDGTGKKVGEAEIAKMDNNELYLSWLGIKSSARGRGYATAVMKAGAEFGKQQGFKKMFLEVPGNSPDARHIYEKLGFKVTGEVDGGVKDDTWGGLTKMEYEFDAQHNHEGGVVMVTRIVDEKPSLDELMHVGVLGMKWGHRKKATGKDIRSARSDVRAKSRHLVDLDAKVENAKTATAKASAEAKLKTAETKFLNDPNRVIATRLTRGEKAAAYLLTGPVGIAAIVATSIASRRIERKQDTNAYGK